MKLQNIMSFTEYLNHHPEHKEVMKLYILMTLVLTSILWFILFMIK
jgi:hypothetical protein